MTFKGQCHYINGRVQRSVVGQHNGIGPVPTLGAWCVPWDGLATLKDGPSGEVYSNCT